MRMKTLNSRGIMAAAMLAFGMALPVAARADEARAVLSPPTISLDDSAELRIPSAGNVASEQPVVPGLRFRPVGKSSETTVVNGQVSQHTWTLYEVSASQPGAYRIPIGTQQLTLMVEPSGGDNPPQPQAGSATAQSSGAEAGPLAFLRTQLPHGKFYVGQAIPIAFKAYFRPGTEVTIAAPPSLGNPTFTISDLSEKPVQGTQIVGGREYGVATWTALISGTMPGILSTEVSLPIAVRYREAGRSNGLADPFGDPFGDDPTVSSMMKSMLGSSLGSGFGNAFQAFSDPVGPVRERELTLQAPAEQLTLLPLPLAGRPSNFSGAVGQFEVTAKLTPSAGVAFEPMSLQLAVSGQGNFDRVALAGLASASDFKAYPVSASFVPNSPHSTFTGTKTFVQPIVAQQSGTLGLPAVGFSFFDPKTGGYVTKNVSPPAVIIAAAAAATVAGGHSDIPVLPGVASAASASASPNGLRPDHALSGPAATLRLPERQAWFWGLGLAPLLGLGLAFLAGLRRRGGPSARLRRRELRATLAAQRIDMRKAVERRDAVGFFAAAQAAVQAELSRRWHLPPQAVTDVEVRRRLGEKGWPLADALRMAESVLYGGTRVDPDTLSACGGALEGLLNQLEVVP